MGHCGLLFFFSHHTTCLSPKAFLCPCRCCANTGATPFLLWPAASPSCVPFLSYSCAGTFLRDFNICSIFFIPGQKNCLCDIPYRTCTFTPVLPYSIHLCCLGTPFTAGLGWACAPLRRAGLTNFQHADTAGAPAAPRATSRRCLPAVPRPCPPRTCHTTTLPAPLWEPGVASWQTLISVAHLQGRAGAAIPGS